MPGQESDRHRRIRDEQLRARDPLKKQRRLDREIADKRRRMSQPFSFGRMWQDLPHKWRGTFVGGLIGLGFLIGAPYFIEGMWGLCVGIGAFPFAALVGFLLGRYQDSMEDIRQNLH